MTVENSGLLNQLQRSIAGQNFSKFLGKIFPGSAAFLETDIRCIIRKNVKGHSSGLCSSEIAVSK